MNKLHASLAVISAAAVLGTTGALALPASESEEVARQGAIEHAR